MMKAIALSITVLATACAVDRGVEGVDPGGKSDSDRPREITLAPGKDVTLELACTNRDYECDMSFNLNPVDNSRREGILARALIGKTAADLPLAVYHQTYPKELGLAPITSSLKAAVTPEERFSVMWQLADRTPVWFDLTSHNVPIAVGGSFEVVLQLDGGFSAEPVTFSITRAEGVADDVPL